MSLRTALPRHDLDGLRLLQPGSPDVWLIFGGERHRIASSAVFDALFSEVEKLVPFQGVDRIPLGPELGEGTCLIRADGALSIYLLARASNGQVQKHFIPTYESLVDFAFNEGAVRAVSPLVIEGLQDGVDLVSAADRDARR
jgi:hypothetical protein